MLVCVCKCSCMSGYSFCFDSIFFSSIWLCSSVPITLKNDTCDKFWGWLTTAPSFLVVWKSFSHGHEWMFWHAFTCIELPTLSMSSLVFWSFSIFACHFSGRLVIFSSRNQLKSLPDSICNLHLKTLNLSNNQLASLPNRIGAIVELTTLVWGAVVVLHIKFYSSWSNWTDLGLEKMASRHLVSRFRMHV